MDSILTPGIPDSEFIRGDVPMTKEEVRIISISKMRLKSNDILIDIGAGTGSIAIEAARLLKNSQVFAIEKNPAAIALIKKNCTKFDIKNVNIMQGAAPAVLNGIKKADCIFIGGSGGNLLEILKWSNEHLKSGGRIVCNSITLDSFNTINNYLSNSNFTKLNIIQASITKLEKIGNSKLFKANNPIFIIAAEKI